MLWVCDGSATAVLTPMCFALLGQLSAKDDKIRQLEQDLSGTQQQYAECYDEVSHAGEWARVRETGAESVPQRHLGSFGGTGRAGMASKNGASLQLWLFL